MTIWPTRPRRPGNTEPLAATTIRPPARSRQDRRGRTRLRVGAAATAVATVIGLLLPTPASAAAVTMTLSGAVTAGDPNVTFTATIAGNQPTDTFYLCFGDESTACDPNNPAGSGTVATADLLTGTGVVHAYADGSYTATLYDVTAAPVQITASTPIPVKVTIDATARLNATTSGLTATLDGSASTAAAADTWSVCFGDNPACPQTAADASGTGVPGNAIQHTYKAPGTYPAALTINGVVTSTASVSVTVNYPDPYAVLSADQTTGTGNLTVNFDGSQSVSGPTDTWALCFGDKTCTKGTPDLSGTGPVVLPAHQYPAGNYTATLWVSNGTTTSAPATLPIAVGNSVAAPDGTCSLTGVIRTCDLFAKNTGSVSVGSSSIPFWGFTTSDAAAPVLGGPKLIATVGERLAFTVHNELDSKAGNVAITVPALSGAPDPTGVAPGSTGASGTFTLTTPGTYIYEAGLTSGGERQVAMGLSGVLIVRPSVTTSANSARCAYNSAVAATDCVISHEAGNYFDREKLVVVTELDDKYNADPFGTDTGDYHPTHFFLDGVAYDPAKPALDPSDPTSGFSAAADNVRFDAAPGDTVLLRYADLGLREHSLNLMNLLQTETARDAHLLPDTTLQNTEFLNAGQTADTFLTIPPGAVTGTRYPLFDAGFHLNNGETGGLGGMYTYLDVVNGATAAAVGPVGSAASAAPAFDPTAPNIDNGQVPTLAVAATFTAQAPAAGGSTPTVASVQWALDGVPGPTGFWQHPSLPTPAGGTTDAVKFTIDKATLTQVLGTEPGRAFGDHTIWLQAKDSNGNFGPAVGAVFTLAMRDPVITGLSINPPVTNGSTVSNQLPVASTKIAQASNGQEIPQRTINVDSTKGFPGTCPVGANGCLITVGLTIADGPAQGSIVYSTFTYTGLTPTSFTGVTATSRTTVEGYELTLGNTVGLDVTPAGYIAVNGTAAASLPGFVVSAAQACVIYSTGAAPSPADAVDTKCDPTNTKVATRTVFPLSVPNGPGALAAVNGFLPAPRLPTGVRNAGNFWVMVRAQEGPDGGECTVAGTCRWSPWLYYSGSTVDPSTFQALTLVKTGPTTGPVAVTPNPNNGFDAAAGNLGLFDSFSVSATAQSQWANIALAETFMAPTSRPRGTAAPRLIRCTGTNTPAGCVVYGKGAEMTPADGFWNNSHTKSATAFLPLSQLQGMPDGLVRVWMHAQDIAGNWGAAQPADLMLDRTPPAVDSLTNTAAAAKTTTAAAATLPLTNGSLVVAAITPGLPGKGSVAVTTSTGVQVLTYTGSSTVSKTKITTLTGVSGGTAAAVAVGATVVAFTGSVTVKAHDTFGTVTNNVSSGVAKAEWFVGADPGPGKATPAVTVPATWNPSPNTVNPKTFTLTGLPAGQIVNVRVVDAAGNWSKPIAVTM